MKCKLSGLLLLAALLMPAAVWASQAPGNTESVVYDNTGPMTGLGASFPIVPNDMGSNAVTDPFGCCGVADKVQFLVWAYSPVTSVDWAITTAPFGGTMIESGTAYNLGNEVESESEGGTAYLETFSLYIPVSAGWLQLSNAVASDEGGFVGWDMSGSGTTAYWNSSDSPIPSETFQMLGTSEDCVTPEPSSFLLLGSGLAGLAGLIKRKLTA
jgi:hypothetical protein